MYRIERQWIKEATLDTLFPYSISKRCFWHGFDEVADKILILLKMKHMRNPFLPQSKDDNATLIIYLVLAVAFLAAFFFLAYGSSM